MKIQSTVFPSGKKQKQSPTRQTQYFKTMFCLEMQKLCLLNPSSLIKSRLDEYANVCSLQRYLLGWYTGAFKFPHCTYVISIFSVPFGLRCHNNKKEEYK